MTLFVTGASGFLGAAVRQALEARGHRLVCLQRSANGPGGVRGDLLSPSTYETHLEGADAVVHLAAVTGKAAPSEYQRVNVEGTRALLQSARRAGVPRILFCSSIAVTFSDLHRYYYAQSKLAAEQLVAESGLRFTTVRPTIISGPGSPVMSKLESLASLPIVPLFGDGRTRVQPIDVKELADLIVRIVEIDRFEGETLECGGSDVLTLRELLDRMHRQAKGGPARFLPIPMGLVLPVVGLLERLVNGAMPLTVGQLATFRFDGVATGNAQEKAPAVIARP